MHWWYLWLWGAFLLGQAVHVLKRADLSASSPISAGTQLTQWFQRNWPNVVQRLFYCSLLFMIWLASGTGDTTLGKILEAVGGTVVQKYLPVPAQLSLIVIVSSMAFGFFGDSAIDYLQAKFWPASQKETQA